MTIKSRRYGAGDGRVMNTSETQNDGLENRFRQREGEERDRNVIKSKQRDRFKWMARGTKSIQMIITKAHWQARLEATE